MCRPLRFLLVLFCLLTSLFSQANIGGANYKVSRWEPIVRRECQAVFGLNCPVAMLLGQIKQESGGDDKVTAWDLGRGLGQFMDGTAKQVSRQFPELGAPNPYNATWAIRAQSRLDFYNFSRTKGYNECEKAGGGLKAYNAGLGFVLRAQKKSPDPKKWFGLTEFIPVGQSAKNMEYSREYSRWILFKHQRAFAQFGGVVCDLDSPPPDRRMTE